MLPEAVGLLFGGGQFFLFFVLVVPDALFVAVGNRVVADVFSPRLVVLVFDFGFFFGDLVSLFRHTLLAHFFIYLYISIKFLGTNYFINIFFYFFPDILL